MKKTMLALGCSFVLLTACNNQSADPVETADSTNEAKQDQSPVESKTQENTSEFLVKAADYGLAEVELGNLGTQKATQQPVKDFAAMLVKDHSAVNDQVKALAATSNVTLPAATSEDNRKKVTDLGEKKPKDFDKDFLDVAISNHKKTIDLFKDVSDDDIHPDVKTFINNTLPKLQAHLDAAEGIRKGLK